MKDKKILLYRILLLVTIIGWGLTSAYFSVAQNYMNEKIDDLQSQVNSLKQETTELSESLEAYSDNYVALWNTINNME